MIRVRIEPRWDDFRAAARQMLARDVAPDAIFWDDGTVQQIPFGIVDFAREESGADTTLRVPTRFARTGELVSRHTDSDRWAILYGVLWRITHEDRRLMEIDSDPSVMRLLRMAQAIRRDIHKTHAFVRFKQVDDDGGERWIAWYEPDFDTLELSAPFFVERFRVMRWSILTPRQSVHWNGEALSFEQGVPAGMKPDGDDLEELWRTYYGAIFNPARLNLDATRAEMPTRKWKYLPETAIIPDLVRDAADRVGTMVNQQRAAPDATPYLPDKMTITAMREAVHDCRGCELWKDATHAVFGEGTLGSRIVLVGEQPGDQEDLAGRPFVGPAGRILDEAIEEAGLERSDLYLTNAVKHFRFEERGERRIHKKPTQLQIRACQPWLAGELSLVKPRAVVALGATAAQSLFGGGFRVMRDRGSIFESKWAPISSATLHPSAVLRSRDSRDEYRRMIVDDLRLVRDAIGS